MVKSLNIDYKRFVFIDLGSGKGRNLVLAAQIGLACIEGIELSARLHQMAVENTKSLRSGDNEILCRNLDAAAYEFPPNPFVIFAFNPFQERVVARVLSDLEKSLLENLREGYILYLNPRYKELLNASAMIAEMPRSALGRLVDWVISPWPILVHKTVGHSRSCRRATPFANSGTWAFSPGGQP